MYFKSLKYFFIVSFIFAYIFSCRAQGWLWTKSGAPWAVGGGFAESFSACIDTAGNIFTAGLMYKEISYGTCSITSNNNNYVSPLITKHSPNGTAIWTRTANGPLSPTSWDNNSAKSVCADRWESIYVTGWYLNDSIIFGSYSLPLANPTNGGSDIFVVKYNANGNVIWAKRSGGGGCDRGNAISSYTGGIYVAGTFSGQAVAFGSTTLSSNGSSNNFFLCKLDTGGNVIWSRGGFTSIGSGTNEILSVAADKYGNAYVTGSSSGSGAIIIGSYTVGSSGYFIAKYDPNCNVLWADGGYTSLGRGNSISCDRGGLIYVTGSYTGTSLTFETSSVSITNPSGNVAIFLACYNSIGNLQWAKSIGGGTYDVGLSVASYSSGVYLAGVYTSSNLTFDNILVNSPPSAYYPLFFAKYGSNGNAICATTVNNGSTRGTGLCTDSLGNAYLASDFSNTTVVLGTTTLTKSGTFYWDNFLAKHDQQCDAQVYVGISEGVVTTDSRVYPNPVSGYSFKVDLNQILDDAELIVSNSLGQKVLEQKLFYGENEINANELSSGVYYYSITDSKKQVQIGKLLVRP